MIYCFLESTRKTQPISNPAYLEKMKQLLAPVLVAIAGLTAAPETIKKVQDEFAKLFRTVYIQPIQDGLDDPCSIGRAPKTAKASEAAPVVENGRLRMSKLDMGKGLDMGKRQ